MMRISYVKTRIWVALLLATAVCPSAVASAAEFPYSVTTAITSEAPKAPPNDQGPQVIPFELDGQPGLWVPQGIARRLLFDINNQTAQISALENRLRVEVDRTTLLQEQLQDSQEETKVWADVAEKQAKALEPPAWWQSRTFWAIAGGLIGVGLTIGTVSALSNVR